LAVTDSSVLLGGMITLFVGSFVWLTWLTHARFGTFGFDLGIFDQGVWLLSRFRDPFVTIRGLPLFGDHASYILVLVAPLYWIWADPRLLLLLQVVFLAIPAASVYLIGMRRLGSALLGWLLRPPIWRSRRCSGPRSGTSTPRPWRPASWAWPP